MTFWTLIRRSLVFHARAHLGVVLGAAVGSAALIGALVVGDSVRESLKEMAMARLGRVETAMATGDRFFRAQLGGDKIAAALQLAGTASAQDGSARANHVQLLGVNAAFWQLAEKPPALNDLPPDAVVLNEPLAQQLKAKVGDTVLLRVEKPSLLSRDAPISPQEDASVALRLKVLSIVSDEQGGRFSLQANQVAPFNAFVSLARLQEEIGQTNRANLLLIPVYSTNETFREKISGVLGEVRDGLTGHHTYTSGGGPIRWMDPTAKLRISVDEYRSDNEDMLPAMISCLRYSWQLEDAQLTLREIERDGAELRSDRIFLDPPVVEAAKKIATNAQPIITYLVNEIRDKDKSTPYSMVTAMGAPIVPPDMRDDEIIINDWLSDDLEAVTGDTISLAYYVVGNGRALEEHTNTFRVRSVVPLSGAAADRSLMPDFPGIAQAESTQNWDAGFPIDVKKIRFKDEEYWKQHRGTPKAFVTLAAGQKMWSNRFGDLTAIRFPDANLATIRSNLQATLDPASLGLKFEPVREQALAASAQGVDFGGLFIGFSFFLIIAALLLMALLFQFGLEQRATETGTLLALGFRPAQVRRLLLLEGVALALVGGVIGAAGGALYAKAMLQGLTTVWRGAVGTSALRYHATPETLVFGTFGAALVASATIWLALRRQARQPARELMAEGARESGLKMEDGGWKRNRSKWVAMIAGLAALGLVGSALWQKDTSSAETFFSAGSLLLIAGLGFSAAWLAALGRRADSAAMTVTALGLRGATRRRKRSLATIGLLACGAFLIVAVGAFRLDANQDATQHSSGTGGFALLGESTLPLTYDLNAKAGRDFYGLTFPGMTNARVVAFRVRDGDEASCLNLNRAQKPRLLGVNPQSLEGRFTFAGTMKGLPEKDGWLLLKSGGHKPPLQEGEIPAIGDENSILWAMGKKVGDTVDYTDERGQTFKLRLVGAVANSVLQGNLIIDEAEFVKRFPSESGYRMFLIDAPSNSVAAVSAGMTRALEDAGLELTPAAERLNAFNAVQNTYLGTFQVLGGLGLLLGSAGLGVVVLRNVQERRGELALLLAVGFRRGALQRLVLSEHGALLGLGLGVGVLAAAVAVVPSLLSPGSQVPYLSLGITLGAVLLNGLLWTWLATRFALRGRLLDALRNE